MSVYNLPLKDDATFLAAAQKAGVADAEFGIPTKVRDRVAALSTKERWALLQECVEMGNKSPEQVGRQALALGLTVAAVAGTLFTLMGGFMVGPPMGAMAGLWGWGMRKHSQENCLATAIFLAERICLIQTQQFSNAQLEDLRQVFVAAEYSGSVSLIEHCLEKRKITLQGPDHKRLVETRVHEITSGALQLNYERDSNANKALIPLN